MSVGMTDKNLLNETNHEYEGDLDDKGLRTGTGCEQWFGKSYQKYAGDFLQNNIHGLGFFTFEKGGERYFYDGFFYANKFEGYGLICYENGNTFQGLFKQSRRYGPGVLTYLNGTQDVGFWYGDSLFRLGVAVQPDMVPKLAKTAIGRIKLLRFRNLIPINPGSVDIATEILKQLGAKEEILSKAYNLYCPEARSPNSLFFNKNLYDSKFYKEEGYFINVIVSDKLEDMEEMPQGKEEKCFDETCPNEGRSERYTNICTTLYDVEQDLNRVRETKKQIKAQIKSCQECCIDSQMNVSEKVEEDFFHIQDYKIQQEDPTTECGLLLSKSKDTPLRCEDRRGTLPFIYMKSDECTDTSKTTCECEELEVDDIYKLDKALQSVSRKELFLETIIHNLKKKLNQSSVKIKTPKPSIQTKKNVVTDLLAWNNGQIMMNMLKHTFINRKTEQQVDFSVSHLVTAQRLHFSDPGPYESLCIQFLKDCSRGKPGALFDMIRNERINPDLSDANGNSGILFAAAKDNIAVISMLINAGANVDHLNDEGLTPLTMCILRYLTLKNGVDNWEVAFLPDIFLDEESKQEVKRWYPNKTLLDVGSSSFHESIHSTSSSSNLSKKQKHSQTPNPLICSSSNLIDLDESNTYLKQVKDYYMLKTSQMINEQYKNFFSAPPVPSVYIFDQSQSVKKSVKKIVDDDESIDLPERYFKKMLKVDATILLLLKHGADPNVGEVPFPALILSVYTENPVLVQSILDNNADPKVITYDDHLNCLHVISSLKASNENFKIFKILLKRCDVNARCSPHHWPLQKQQLLYSSEDCAEDQGKTPLHILAMRGTFDGDTFDILEAMAALLTHKVKDTSEKYLGHTALSLAVVYGNIPVIQGLLASNRVDPHDILECNMGNVFTILGLRKFANRHSLDKVCLILETLIQSGGCPLVPVGQFENAIAFLERPIMTSVSSHSKKSLQKSIVSAEDSVKLLLRHLARRELLLFEKSNMIRLFYELGEMGLLENSETERIAQFFTPQEVFETLRVTFKSGYYDFSRFGEVLVERVIDFVQKVHSFEKKKEKKKKNVKIPDSGIESVQVQPVFAVFISDFLPKKIDISDRLIFPEVDKNYKKYKVCFHCLKGRSRFLIKCPNCELVSFCSETCNMANRKLNELHFCNVFYNKQKKLLMTSKYTSPFDSLKSNVSDRLTQTSDAGQQTKFGTPRDSELSEDDSWDYENNRRKRKGREASKKAKGREKEDGKKGRREKGKAVKKDKDKRLKDKRSKDKKLRDKKAGGAKGKKLTKEEIRKRKQERLLKISKATQTAEKERLRKESEKRLKQKTDEKMQKSSTRAKFTKGFGEGRDMDESFTVPDVIIEPGITCGITFVDKMRRLPKKYQFFLELLTKFFPDMDLSYLFVPFACYINGQLYYKFLDCDAYRHTYSTI